jgi:molybdenum cofactor cytidylyltransferase
VISAVVLAAGVSTRFGSTKQLARLGGTPLVQRVIETAAHADGVDEVVVVLGHDADAVRAALQIPSNCRPVVNPSFSEGLSSSLAAGLGAASEDSEAAVVLLADQPGMGVAVVEALVVAFRRGRSRIVRARFDDGPGPALLSREIWAEAAHLTGDLGARTLIDRHPEWVQEVGIEGTAPPDVDTKEDAAALGIVPSERT